MGPVAFVDRRHFRCGDRQPNADIAFACVYLCVNRGPQNAHQTNCHSMQIHRHVPIAWSRLSCSVAVQKPTRAHESPKECDCVAVWQASARKILFQGKLCERCVWWKTPAISHSARILKIIESLDWYRCLREQQWIISVRAFGFDWLLFFDSAICCVLFPCLFATQLRIVLNCLFSLAHQRVNRDYDRHIVIRLLLRMRIAAH